MKTRFIATVLFVVVFLFGVAYGTRADELATLTGRVTDAQGLALPGVKVEAVNINTNVVYPGESNAEGIYQIPNVPPGTYRVVLQKAGFSQVVKPGVELHVQDVITINFTMPVGSVTQTVTVEAGASMINTTDASISTVVDQSYIKNMPLNGRSFQDLILLTPGIVTQTSQSGANFNAGLGQTGEFSVNGQRAESNTYTVDGVSATLGATPGQNMFSGAGASGSVGAATAQGTTQALVSVDDLQEFRVQSSTYSAEYGRNPGGQFTFQTKSGTNQWHGTAYDYLRNDFFDANDWFNDYLRGANPSLTKPALRQNDFGGTLGAPFSIPHLYNGKDKTFFFVSYEGLRLLQPQPASQIGVPNLCLRGQASASCSDAPADPALQPVLDAFPLPTPGLTDFGDGFAPFIGTWSNPSSIDSTSVRFDHSAGDKLRLFFRFSNTDSNSSVRGQGGASPTLKNISAYTMRTYTAGATSVFSSRINNEFRLNYSSNDANGNQVISPLSGSTPVDLAKLTGLSSSSTVSVFACYFNGCPLVAQGPEASSQRQWNLVDTVSYSVGRHQLKFGVDYRRLAPFIVQQSPSASFFYQTEASLQNTPNTPDFFELGVASPAYPLYKNFSAFAQDDWRVSPRLNLSMGLRWEVNPPPGVTQGLLPYTVRGSGPDTWAVAPQGTPLWNTTWYNFAPRLGAAYTLREASGWETVVRTGGGLFFDTGQQLGSVGFEGPGFSAANFAPPFPPFPQVGPLPAILDPTTSQGQPYSTQPFAFPAHFQLPYTLQWNGSVEQAVGKSQTITLSYVGAHAGRLLREEFFNTPNNPNSPVLGFLFVTNGLTSDYHSGQAQYRRRLSRGLTALGSYTWAHCIDYGSQNYNLGYQRGSCDYDVRHNFSGAFSYDLPNGERGGFVNALVRHWGLDDRLTARSGFPITFNGNSYVDPRTGKRFNAGLDLVANQPLYLYGANCDQFYQGASLPGGCPGGRAINPNAFAPVPVDANLQPTRLGNAPRNLVRGFGAWQMDLAVRREFPIYERLKLQFRAEAFNIFNHPNFGTINTFYCSPDPNDVNNFFPGCNFGQAGATLSNSLGILSPLYQMGGARSMQFALKLAF